MTTKDTVGQRIRECLRELGYWYAHKDRPDVIRFAMTHGIIPAIVYRWVNDEAVPDVGNFERLGRILEANPAWLQWGPEYAPKQPPAGPKGARTRRTLAGVAVALALASGGPVDAPTQAPARAISPFDPIPLIGSVFRRWRDAWRAMTASRQPRPGPCPALAV